MMAHTRGGGIGNMAGSDDRTLGELIAELRQRVQDDKYQGYAEVSGDELERLFEAMYQNAQNGGGMSNLEDRRDSPRRPIWPKWEIDGDAILIIAFLACGVALLVMVGAALPENGGFP